MLLTITPKFLPRHWVGSNHQPFGSQSNALTDCETFSPKNVEFFKNMLGHIKIKRTGINI